MSGHIWTADEDTWTLGPKYPAARCTRCGADADPEHVASGFCWRCGYLGAVEFKEDDAE